MRRARRNKKRVVFLVHGTFAGTAEWTKPSGRFCSSLLKDLPGTQFEAFKWDGTNSHASRLRAARNLARHIARASTRGLPIYIIGHSHGGNVGIAADNLCGQDGSVKGVVCLSTPFLEFGSNKTFLSSFLLGSQILNGFFIPFTFVYILLSSLIIGGGTAHIFKMMADLFNGTIDHLLQLVSSQDVSLAIVRNRVRYGWLCFFSASMLFQIIGVALFSTYQTTQRRWRWATLFEYVRVPTLIICHGQDEAYWLLKLASVTQNIGRVLSRFIFLFGCWAPFMAMILTALISEENFSEEMSITQLYSAFQYGLAISAIVLLDFPLGGPIRGLFTRLAPIFGLPGKKTLRTPIHIRRSPRLITRQEEIVWVDKENLLFPFLILVPRFLVHSRLAHSFIYEDSKAVSAIVEWIKKRERPLVSAPL